jgi:hypothetical protein
MKKIAVFGDSFVEGARRISQTDIEITDYNICYWLEKELGVEVHNYGKGGASNQSIANSFFRWARKDRSDFLVLFVWTECNRGTIVNPIHKDGQNFNTWQYITSAWSANQDDPERRYRNPALGRMWFEQSMQSCRMLCEDKSIPYLMTSSVTNDWFLHKQLFNQDNGRPIISNIDFQFGRAKENWIEPHLPNNTMLDILSNNWLNKDRLDNINIIKLRRYKEDFRKDKHQETLTWCLHPTDEGNKLIAKTLAPYIKRKLEE